MYEKPFNSIKKTHLRFLAFLLCAMLVTSTLLPVYADKHDDEGSYELTTDFSSGEDDGQVTDSIVTGLGSYTVDAINFAGELFVKLLTVSFAPSINPLLNIEQGFSFSTPIIDDAYYEGATIDNSFTIMAIWEFSFMFGVITCTLLMFFYLAMCLVGQQEQIRDTPFMLVVKYLLALFLIYMSKYFITAFIDFFNDMWTNLVLTKEITTPTTYTAFLPIWWENGDLQNGDLVVFGVKILSHSGSKLTLLSLLGVSPALTVGATTPLVVGVFCVVIFFAIYFGWKIIKEFMKLFLEVVERYFVLFFLLAFFPALASTLVSNNSKKIFYAYVKMLYSQAFLLLINTIFMAIFFKILLAGGWTAGLINYIGALAFLRICQRVDAYMAQLGINIVQTGGGLMSACGSVFGGALAGMSAMRGLERARKNAGSALMQKGMSSGNFNTFSMGKSLGMTGSDMLLGNVPSKDAMQSGFTQQVLQNKASNTSTTQNSFNLSSEGGGGTWVQQAQSQGLPTPLIENMQKYTPEGTTWQSAEIVGNGKNGVMQWHGTDKNGNDVYATTLNDKVMGADENKGGTLNADVNKNTDVNKTMGADGSKENNINADVNNQTSFNEDTKNANATAIDMSDETNAKNIIADNFNNQLQNNTDIKNKVQSMGDNIVNKNGTTDGSYIAGSAEGDNIIIKEDGQGKIFLNGLARSKEGENSAPFQEVNFTLPQSPMYARKLDEAMNNPNKYALGSNSIIYEFKGETKLTPPSLKNTVINTQQSEINPKSNKRNIEEPQKNKANG